MAERPTALEAEQLVSLRIMLDDALRRSKVMNRYQRGGVVVALDSVVERSSALVAAARGLDLPRTTIELVSRLKESLGDAWKPTVLADIRHLHKARNHAQHEGLQPDRERIPGWATATAAYVASLVHAQFDIDIRRVVLADAIRDVAIGNLIRAAQRALEQDDFSGSVGSSRQAFESALVGWRRLHRSGKASLPYSRGGLPEFREIQGLENQLDRLARIMDGATFSVDMAEFEWFQTLAGVESELFDADDAERALAFSFGWVANFEVAHQGWVTDRRHRRDVERRLVRASNEQPACLMGLAELQPWGTDLRARVVLKDVPQEKEYDEWSRVVEELLDDRREWRVLPDGSVQLTLPEPWGNLEHRIRTLQQVLVNAETRILEQRSKRESAESERQARTLKRDAEVEALADSLPDWVRGVRGRLDEWRPDGWVVKVDDRVRAVAASPESSSHRLSLIDLIRDDARVNQCYWSGDCELIVEPGVVPAELLAILQEADDVVAQHLRRMEADEGLRTDRVRTARDTIQRLLERDSN